MIRMVDLAWTPGRRWPGGWAWGLLFLLALGVAALVHAKSNIDARLQHRQLELERVMARTLATSTRRREPESVRSPAELRLLRDQVALLNRDWADLLGELVPGEQEIKLLELDINAETGVMRLSGRATNANGANTYAETLQARDASVQDVRLLLLERKPGGIDFEVSARWAE